KAFSVAQDLLNISKGFILIELDKVKRLLSLLHQKRQMAAVTNQVEALLAKGQRTACLEQDAGCRSFWVQHYEVLTRSNRIQIIQCRSVSGVEVLFRGRIDAGVIDAIHIASLLEHFNCTQCQLSSLRIVLGRSGSH